ncbi:MAG: amino acid carrier protein [Planctomycetes bacterium]|nr:amino acid carrier protein [Planctomycetota bacterium]NOG54229.1 amino acid carrier protein [Planctomycetota bacterium]
MDQVFEWIGEITGILWGPWTFFVLMGAGILFTIWSRFSQYRAMTHGIAVVRGLYDDPDDPGAINHFQALSAALSATVGLGNIGGVALAIAAGGPGALVWMWIIGFFGMALKTVEITLAMIYRNTDDPDNPHGGAMWVIDKALGGRGGAWKSIAKTIGVFFCITLIISAITGGNMFQSWNVANMTSTYFDVPKVASGIILALLVGAVIVGGIKRIGTVAGKLVPFMCVLYVLCGLAVLAKNIDEIPRLFALIFSSAFNPSDPVGPFLGGSIGFAFSQGLRRALFSNEAGQGSAPIAHAAAKTDEPAREGIVGGIGPFIDTICICTLTALVILCPGGTGGKGAWNRDPLMNFALDPVVTPSFEFVTSDLIGATESAESGESVYITLEPGQPLVENGPAPSTRLWGVLGKGGSSGLQIAWKNYNAYEVPVAASLDVKWHSKDTQEELTVGTIAAMPTGTQIESAYGLVTAPQQVVVSEENEYLWENIRDVFTVVEADPNEDTNSFARGTEKERFRRWQLKGLAHRTQGEGLDSVTVEWEPITSDIEPQLAGGTGMYRNYAGAELTAHAFDRQFPGLGKWLVTFAAWLFALSTMISWSYYGEQGMIYMLGQRSVLPYKLVYLLLVIVAAVAITDTGDMEAIIDLGTGAMLWSNIPIVLGCGFLSIKCLKIYDRRLKAGEFVPHKAPTMTDVMDGHDVEKKD